ncbi:MAG: TolC family protein [Muribaculaceae bacterium]|nr:TolC family protein [Muribaculaceae bacterium]
MKHILIIVSILTALSCQAQIWTLDSCINYAIEHNITVQERALDKINADNQISEAKSAFLPTAAASASQSFNFGRGLTSENMYANRNTANTQWNVGINLPIFQGLSNIRQLAYAKASLRAIVESYEAAKDDVTLNVISLYLQALYNEEIYAIAKEQEALSANELQRRHDLMEAGKIQEIDVLEAQALLAQDQLATVNAHNDYTMALVDLAQLLHLRQPEQMQIAPVDSPLPIIPEANIVYQKALTSNHYIISGKERITAAQRYTDVAKTGYMPRLNFNAGIGSSYYKVSGFDSPAFSTQMHDNFNTYLGFSLSIPIFDAFSTRNNVRKARIQLLTAKLDLEQAEDNLFKAIQQSYYAAISAATQFEASSEAERATNAALQAILEIYDVGRATSTEFETARVNYLKAKSQRVRAKYELLLRTRILEFYNR